ncbi:hypothetical protein SCLCIDRAFT_1213702 [Scleroderma citrinum Foug A]|uniref:Sld7 C-terminal domain-containing protein n=1 Tax=Scleroderma citrinum Foug A TaxID=1036808 RepID=A0A0C3AG50_9AGAM|nr:hypothetical protein SCLCIDRAFT_1213702 [Scleroderma citrinum Foug A]
MDSEASTWNPPLLSATPGERSLATPMPSITITDATPTKHVLSSSQSPIPASSSSGSYRLLYRGALSLPDSHILLDGLTFSARLPGNIRQFPCDSPSSLPSSDSLVRGLIHNPLALALESMRGRPSLRFKGTVRLKDIWMDETGEVYMDIHDSATLSRVYFENTLCLSPLITVPCGAGSMKRTEVGVHVALGDTDGLETTEVIIYGEATNTLHLPVAVSSSTSHTPPLVVRVARITPAPRAPRPDDPTPRKPPTQSFIGSTVGELGANKRITVRPMTIKVAEHGEEEVVRRAREVMLHLPRQTGVPSGTSGVERKAQRSKQKNKESGKDQPKPKGSAVFKIPDVPQKARRNDTRSDVFGTIEHPPDPVNGSGGTGKGKGRAVGAEIEAEGNECIESIEAENKLVIKRSAVRRLAQVGISHTHPEFKDLFGFIYRGTSFALRAQMKAASLSLRAVNALVEAHAKLYVVSDERGVQTVGNITGNSQDVFHTDRR